MLNLRISTLQSYSHFSFVKGRSFRGLEEKTNIVTVGEVGRIIPHLPEAFLISRREIKKKTAKIVNFPTVVKFPSLLH